MTETFPLLQLPAELRESVYEYLIDEGYGPTRRRDIYARRGFINYTLATRRRAAYQRVYDHFRVLLRKILPRKTLAIPQASRVPTRNSIMLVNRQLYDEFMTVVCRKATFNLPIDNKSDKNDRLWPLSSSTMKSIQKCNVQIVATSRMLGGRDPRIAPTDSALRDKVARNLKEMENIRDLRLQVQAIGDPLWNPLWVWYHTTQLFKDMEEPRFQGISFHLDSWSPGENRLVRDKEGQWEWRCPADHLIIKDSGKKQAIREFCATLYAECQNCEHK
ncbi:hypothetical protein H2201_002731 [Coniosporium apollinis]|uniref:Uncharacterized protein n=2 Tax=Coniosporium TaxID=2810619 RepID=A0ABQ9P0V2_9PEZI|nr:hypothetical protein H2199_007036 [Cladosporium sp. JES 115]KAJ9667210.1 hypothetical protein H2201_002731 [Coniosporium apollinis]